MSDPGLLGNLRNAATAHYRRGEFEAAERVLAQALRIDPGSAELWSNFGTVQGSLERHQDALESFTRALRLKPGLAHAVANRAHTLFILNRYAEAIPDFEATLRLAPEHPYALGDLLFCKLQCADWRDFDTWRATARAEVHAGRRAMTPVLAALFDSPGDQRRAVDILARDKLPQVPPLWRGERYRHGRIRVAYISADFHAHATAVLMAGVIENSDRARFENFAFSFGPDDGSPMRARLARAFEHFNDVRRQDEGTIANLIRRSEIDIAVDLKGFTSGARPAIFAFRPAPVQVNYLAFPGTMASALMDYFIADAIVVPQGDERFYAEKIVRLPGSYQPNDCTRAVAATPSRAQAGLPDSGFVFCCFNNSYKIEPVFFDVWMRLLAAVPGSVLWLLEDNPTATPNLRREAESRGVSGARLIFAPRAAQEDHLARQRLADLFLDTLPYNAHTTASDALFVSLPVLTVTGATFAGRVAASLLHAMGLPELVTASLADYETLALALARDPQRLADLRARLAANRDTAPLFDVARYTKGLEAAYRTMWEKSQRGEQPESFSVAPAE